MFFRATGVQLHRCSPRCPRGEGLVRDWYAPRVGAPIVTHEELEELRPVLEPLKIGGHYLAADLYVRHVRVMRDLFRKPPAHAVRFGQILTAYGALRKPKWDRENKCMAKGWVI